MCGRFAVTTDPALLAEKIHAIDEATEAAKEARGANYNVAPTQESLVLRFNPATGERSLDPLRWGLVPRWAKDASGAAKLMNARSEGVAEKPSFRAAFRERRRLN